MLHFVIYILCHLPLIVPLPVTYFNLKPAAPVFMPHKRAIIAQISDNVLLFSIVTTCPRQTAELK